MRRGYIYATFGLSLLPEKGGHRKKKRNAFSKLITDSSFYSEFETPQNESSIKS